MRRDRLAAQCACVLPPLAGESFAGLRGLDMAGMLWFAAAHTLFFVTTALLCAR